MKDINKCLHWHRTSRNTEIAVHNHENYGRILFKRGVLIQDSELKLHINSFITLKEITDSILGVESPCVYPELCSGNIVALQYIPEKSFHEHWLNNDYKNENVITDINILYEKLKLFHDSTLLKNSNMPYAYKDYGPKNVIKRTNDDIVLIDPPLIFVRECPINDFGTLVFEIDRSLFQTKNIGSITKNHRIAYELSQSTMANYKLYKKGFRKHVFYVIARYLNFMKKPNPIYEFIKAMIFIPCILIYFISVETFDFCLMGSRSAK